MYLRRMLVALPPALLVAVAAHAAGFGASHVLGGSAGQPVFALGLAWAALLVIAGILAVALGGRSHSSALGALADVLPGRGNLAGLAATVAAGGAILYAGLEALEGHGPAGSPLALAVIVPLAIAISAGLGLLLEGIAGAGLSLAEFGRSRLPATTRWFHLAPIPVRAARTAAPHGRRRGRAPPSRA